MELLCPSCNNNKVDCIGEIPSANQFGGKTLGYFLAGGSLWRCNACHLYFRWPRLTKAELDELYKKGNPNNWQSEPNDRNDWKLAATWLNSKLNQGKILDIGCWDGGFLDYLGNRWQRYGIEINGTALQKAIVRGINIIRKNFDELDKISTQFDVIVAFDVIEHTENPLNFIASISQVTKDKGLIIVSSGNTEAPTWKITGSRYYYCAISEHISFINNTWCDYVADKLNLEIELIERFSHAGKVGLIEKFLELMKNIIYLITPVLFEKLRKIKHRLYKIDTGNNYDYPPSWMASKDHIVVIFKKKR